MLQDHRMGDGGVRAAQLLGHARVTEREPLDVGLVDDRLVHPVRRRTVDAPVEERVVDHPPGHVRRAVGGVGLIVVVEVVGEAGRVPVDLALDRLGVGVEEQLAGVAPQPLLRLPRAVDPVAVALARADIGQVRVPAVAVDLRQLDPLLAAALGVVAVQQAQLDALGDAAEEREVGPGAVVGGAQRVGPADPLAGRRRDRRRGGRRCGAGLRWHRRILAADRGAETRRVVNVA